MMFSPIALSRLWNLTRSSGSRPAVGSSTIMSRGFPSSAWAMPNPLLHAARKTSSGLRRCSYRFVCSSSALDGFVALACILDSLECRKVIEHILGRNLGIKPKLLWQIAQHSPNFIFLLEDIN